MKKSTLLHIIDDDASVMKLHQDTFDNLGYPMTFHTDPIQFVKDFDADNACCILADIFMPGMTGFSLLTTLREQYKYDPVILFMSARSTVDAVIKSLRLGALNFLEKPMNEHNLIEALHEGLRLADSQQVQMKNKKSYQEKINQLTPREHEVYHLLLQGKLTKVVASDLNVSCSTAEIHRSNVLKKMDVRNVMELLYYHNEKKVKLKTNSLTVLEST